jgi:hypothetical protein
MASTGGNRDVEPVLSNIATLDGSLLRPYILGLGQTALMIMTLRHSSMANVIQHGEAAPLLGGEGTGSECRVSFSHLLYPH